VGVVVTGMGRRNAERALDRALAEAEPECVLTSGFAGGLDAALKFNTIVCETSDERLGERLRGLGATLIRFHCAERIAVTLEEKSALRQRTAAGAVEMESGWIHQVCRARRLSCATVRVISDTAADALPLDFNKLTTSELKLHPGKLALALLAAPHKVPALVRLRRQTQLAAETLAAFLHRFTAG
jgi:hypothetical protein